MFADQSGIINQILRDLGIDRDRLARRGPPQPRRDRDDGQLPLDRLQHPDPAGGDAGHPADLYEAALLDGATRVRQFFSVTIPMLRPTIIFVIITSTIGGLQIFDEPRLFDQNGRAAPTAST